MVRLTFLDRVYHGEQCSTWITTTPLYRLGITLPLLRVETLLLQYFDSARVVVRHQEG